MSLASAVMQADVEFPACRNWGAPGSSYCKKKIIFVSGFLILCVLIMIGNNCFLWDFVCSVLVEAFFVVVVFLVLQTLPDGICNYLYLRI